MQGQGQSIDNMQMSGTPGMANRTATGMAGAGQMGNTGNHSNLTPQQRQQLMLMQQMRAGGMGGSGAGGVGNMGNMSPQAQMAFQQQQARMLAQRQQQSSPLNPNSGNGMGGTPDQFSPGAMRSNSNPNIGISQNARPPSVGDVNAMGIPGTPRVSGRMPSGGTEEYQRQMLAAQRQQMQNQQNQQQQGFPGAQGAGNSAWQQPQMGMPAGTWPQQNQNQQFGMGGNVPPGGNDLIGIPSRSSATPAPMSTQQSPTVPQNDMSEFMKW